MAVVVKGEVTQSLDGRDLTFTDQSTGVGTLISRILVIYDADGDILTTINMGGTLTAPYDITADAYFSFVETIIDNTGTYTLIVNYLSTTFYEITYAPLANKLDCCSCEEKCLNIYKSDIAKNVAELFASRSVAALAQSNIEDANALLQEADCGC